MSTSRRINIIYSALLLLVTLKIWNLMYGAQFLEYDDNIGSVGAAFLLSLFTTSIVIVLWLKWGNIIKIHKWQIILFLIVSSPLTVALIILNYEIIFGAGLKV